MTGEIFTLSNDGIDHLILQFESQVLPGLQEYFFCRRKDCGMSFLSPSQVRLLQFWSLEAGQHLGLKLVPAPPPRPSAGPSAYIQRKS